MLPKVANHLLLHTSRAVALVQNQTGTLRNVLQHQSSGPASSTVPWAAGPGSSWGGSSAGAGPGGAKFNAGSKFYTGYTGAGRAVTQTNASAAQDFAKDDDKEEVLILPVRSRQPSSRSLGRRHSLSFPPGRRDLDHEIGAGVLQTVQLHLHARHTFAPSVDEQQKEVDLHPQLSEDDFSKSPFVVAVEEAVANNDTRRLIELLQWLADPSISAEFSSLYSQLTIRDFNAALRALASLSPAESPVFLNDTYNALLARGLAPNLGTYIYMVTGLTGRDHEVQKALRSLEIRGRRSRFGGYTSENAEQAMREESNAKREALVAEDNFRTAMSIFKAACTTSVGTNAKESSRRVATASRFPLSVYHSLLRSCAYHASTDDAVYVYSHLESRITLSSHSLFPFLNDRYSTLVYPSTTAFYYLITTYVNAGDLEGAEEIFTEFKRLCSRGAITSLDVSWELRIWNKMLEAYFKAGQPATALRLLETMMDAGSIDKDGCKGENAHVPCPASSTFTTIINGFCNPDSITSVKAFANGSTSVPAAVAISDISTALAWFDRLLHQSIAAQNPHQPCLEPTRPNQQAWAVMLDALAQASTTERSRIQDLNRLFDTLVECAPRDKLDVKSGTWSLVLEANAGFLEAVKGVPEELEAAQTSLAFVTRHILLPDGGTHQSRSLLTRFYPQFVRFGMAEMAWELAKRLVKQELPVIAKRQLLRDVVPLALSAIVSSPPDHSTFPKMLEVMRFTVLNGVSPTPAMSQHHLHAYMSTPAQTQRSLQVSDYETLLSCALTFPAWPSSKDLPQGCAYTSLTSLLKTMDDAGVTLVVPNRLSQCLTDALYQSQDANELSAFFADVGPSFQRLKRPSLTPPPMVAEFPPQLIVDAELSRYISEWFPSHPWLTVHDGYTRLQSAVSATSPRYPHPTVLGRLINGLGRAHDLSALQSVYGIAQQVLFSPAFSADPARQSEAWFQIEDQMIVAYAHVGDMGAAFRHRDRITAAGGIPSPDAYGSLIECVRDTTDDTSNAMDLFLESQSLGTRPNVYLYNTIISKLAKARKADSALELFQQMKADVSLRPTSITYGAVIAACARVGDIQAAEQLFEEMTAQPKFRPRIPPYNTMMQMYTHTKPDRQRVLHYHDLMLRAGIQPSAHTYKLLIDAFGTIEPVDVAAMEGTFKELESSSEVSLQGTHWAALINAHGCVLKDLDKAISIFDSISSNPSSHGATLPDAVTYESLINVLVSHKRMDLVPAYLERLRLSDVHMTAYIANLLIKGHTAVGNIDEARRVFENLQDPPSGIAAPNNHHPHDSARISPLSTLLSYREPSTWEAMFRAELGCGHRDRALALLERVQKRQFPAAVYNRIYGILGDDPLSA